jgi:hypothetical protein
MLINTLSKVKVWNKASIVPGLGVWYGILALEYEFQSAIIPFIGIRIQKKHEVRQQCTSFV